MSDDDMPPGFRQGDETAPASAETHHSPCDIKLSEYPPGPGEHNSTPWIMIQTDLTKLGFTLGGEGHLGLEFREGVSFEEAKELAHELDRVVNGVTCTRFLT